MHPATSASNFLNTSGVPIAIADTATTITTTTTTTTLTTTTTSVVVTPPIMRTDERRQQETALFLDKLMPEIIGEIGRHLHESSAMRPSLNAISRVSHSGKSLAIYLCSKLTPMQASDQWQRDWLRLISHFGKDQKERYLDVVKTIAQQLPMTPFNPSRYRSEYFEDVTAPKFIASIPRIKLSCNDQTSAQAALELIKPQLQMDPASRTEITLDYAAKKKKQGLFESLLAAAELHGNCRFNINENAAGSAISAAAKKNLLDYMAFFPSSRTNTANVALALKGNTSIRAASIVILTPMQMDELLLALSGLPRLHRLELFLPGPSSSPALAEMVKRSGALAELKIMPLHFSNIDELPPDAAMIHARAALKLALETRGPYSDTKSIHFICPSLPRQPRRRQVGIREANIIEQRPARLFIGRECRPCHRHKKIRGKPRIFQMKR